MAKLRHIALSVPDPEQSAAFYERVFGFERVNQTDSIVMLSDGVINMALIRFPAEMEAGQPPRVHHFGVVVDDVKATGRRVTEAGGRLSGEVRFGNDVNAEMKAYDPHGVAFDLSEHGWMLPEGK